jgi:hypothetical protein
VLASVVYSSCIAAAIPSGAAPILNRQNTATPIEPVAWWQSEVATSLEYEAAVQNSQNLNKKCNTVA